MGAGMRKAVLGALLFVMMTSLVIVRTMRVDPKLHLEARWVKDRCLNYMERCVPGWSKCCNGMSCSNLSKGYCMLGLEPCVCQLPDNNNDFS